MISYTAVDAFMTKARNIILAFHYSIRTWILSSRIWNNNGHENPNFHRQNKAPHYRQMRQRRGAGRVDMFLRTDGVICRNFDINPEQSSHVETVCLLSKLHEAKHRKQPGCPEEKVKAIEDATRHFQMID